MTTDEGETKYQPTSKWHKGDLEWKNEVIQLEFAAKRAEKQAAQLTAKAKRMQKWAQRKRDRADEGWCGFVSLFKHLGRVCKHCHCPIYTNDPHAEFEDGSLKCESCFKCK